MSIDWDIRREGREWSAEEMEPRWELTPEKFEVYEGQLFWSEEDRLHLLAMLLENVGADAAVRIGSPAIWKAAIAEL